TGSGTTPSSTRSVLVMLHAGFLHSAATCLVGWNQGGDPKAEHLRPNISSAPRSARRQAHHFVFERILAQCSPVAVRRTVYDRALRWSGSRSRIAQDAQIS